MGQASDECWILPLRLPLAVHLCRKTANATLFVAGLSYPVTVSCLCGHFLNFLDMIRIFLGLFLAMHY